MSCGDRDDEGDCGQSPVPEREAEDSPGPCRLGLPGHPFTYIVVQPWHVARPPDWQWRTEMVPAARVTVERIGLLSGGQANA